MTLEVLDYEAKGILAVLVALSNCEVHTYLDKMHVDTMVTEDVVTAMKYGRYGHEESTLVMITRGKPELLFAVDVQALDPDQTVCRKFFSSELLSMVM